MAATIMKKSATSTEVWYAEVKGKSSTGGVQDPTSATVSAAVIRVPDEAGDTRVPATGDYVACTWQTHTGPRYMVTVLLGPDGDVDHEDPTSEEAEVACELWIRLESGSEDVRFRAGYFAVVP